MTHQTNLQTARAPIGWAIGQVFERAKHLGTRLVEVFDICADSWEAAALYDQLSKLSDAELERRGVPRGVLHRCIFETVTKRT